MQHNLMNSAADPAELDAGSEQQQQSRGQPQPGSGSSLREGHEGTGSEMSHYTAVQVVQSVIG